MSPTPDSSSFQLRTLSFQNGPVIIGRTDGVEKIGGEALPTTSNGIFTQGVVSRKQAMISFENGRFFLQDLNSSHGTKVNEERLHSEPVKLRDGDIGDWHKNVQFKPVKATIQLVYPSYDTQCPGRRRSWARCPGRTRTRTAARREPRAQTWTKQQVYNLWSMLWQRKKPEAPKQRENWGAWRKLFSTKRSTIFPKRRQYWWWQALQTLALAVINWERNKCFLSANFIFLTLFTAISQELFMLRCSATL